MKQDIYAKNYMITALTSFVKVMSKALFDEITFDQLKRVLLALRVRDISQKNTYEQLYSRS